MRKHQRTTVEIHPIKRDPNPRAVNLRRSLEQEG